MKSAFALAVHSLISIELQAGNNPNSKSIAASIGANPAYVRRVLSELANAGIVLGHRGRGGGVSLRRPLDAITLHDVSQAVREDLLVSYRNRGVFGHSQSSSTEFLDVLEASMRSAQGAFQKELRGVTVGQLEREFRRRKT